ncbi:DUF6525 family protein [Amylibacter sp.]|jgi:hypothetical protein|nr:DUF6525 family protein [Amylibacter sp.]
MKINNNLGRTSLKRKRRNENPLLDYDRLPRELRAWVANAELPWRPRSVLKAYERAFLKTGDRNKAINELNYIQQRLVAKDAIVNWGKNHPKVK